MHNVWFVPPLLGIDRPLLAHLMHAQRDFDLALALPDDLTYLAGIFAGVIPRAPERCLLLPTYTPI